LFALHRQGHAESPKFISIQALPLNGFGYDRDEELQNAGDELRNSHLAGVGMRVSYYSRIFMKQNALQARF